MSNEIREQAQKQAEISFDGFMVWSKRVSLWACIFLAIVVFGCNAGVEKNTYPAYNGEQYSPTNMN